MTPAHEMKFSRESRSAELSAAINADRSWVYLGQPKETLKWTLTGGSSVCTQ